MFVVIHVFLGFGASVVGFGCRTREYQLVVIYRYRGQSTDIVESNGSRLVVAGLVV